MPNPNCPATERERLLERHADYVLRTSRRLEESVEAFLALVGNARTDVLDDACGRLEEALHEVERLAKEVAGE